MFLIDDLLVSPGSFLIWVMRKVHEAALEELANDSTRITSELSELHRTLETGAITEAQFDQREKTLLDRLDAIRGRTGDFASSEEAPPMKTENGRRLENLSMGRSERVSLCETLDRVLNKGAVVAGEVTISVADIDLIYLGLQIMISSVEAARDD
jgi:hypothetical protein